MTNETKAVEKWVLLRSLHLGHIKESVRAGCLIECDRDANKLVIDGRTYESTKDLDILRKHGWVRPYDENASEGFDEEPVVKSNPDSKANQKNIDRLKMSIEVSDEDSMPTPIDIRHTKQHGIQRVAKKNDLTVIRGDENAEERLARLQTQRKEMPIVEADDSVMAMAAGHGSLNEGQVKARTAEEVERLRQEAIEKAQARKVEAEKKKTAEKASLEPGTETSEPVEPDTEEEAPLEPNTAPSEPVTESVEPTEPSASAEDDEPQATPRPTASRSRSKRKTGTTRRTKKDDK